MTEAMGEKALEIYPEAEVFMIESLTFDAPECDGSNYYSASCTLVPMAAIEP